VRPDISFVMPTYDEGIRLAQTIESIAVGRTTNGRIEIVIVDDGRLTARGNTSRQHGYALPASTALWQQLSSHAIARLLCHEVSG
jgi:Glycosyl transferase family 2